MNKEKSWYVFWLFAIIGSSTLGLAIHPINVISYIFSLIGAICLIYSGYNLGRVL